MRYLLLAMLLTLTGCASKQPPFSLVIDPLLPNTINYNGEINPDNVAAFEQGIANSSTQLNSPHWLLLVVGAMCLLEYD